MVRMQFQTLQLNLAPNGVWVITYGTTQVASFVRQGEAVAEFLRMKREID